MTKDTQVAADGTSTETIHLEVRATADAAVAAVSKTSFPFDTTMQEIEVSEAHTLKADGKSVPVEASAIFEQMPAGQQDMLTGMRSKVIVFPQFAAGDTAVYTIKLVTKQPFFQGQFVGGEVFLRNIAYGEVRETITAPKSMPLTVETHDVASSKREEGNDIVYSWHYSAPKTSPEETVTFSPLEHLPRYFVSSFKDYAALGRAYGALTEGRKIVTPKVSALADQITAGTGDRKMQIQKLYEWVSAHIRYVGIELGTGSFVPHEVDSILANGYGDCKDHDVLLQALLKAKGIDSQSILINSAVAYSLTEAATFSTLDHVITYVPEFGLYMDSSASVAPFGTLPMAEYGKPMVIATTGSAGQGTMPLLVPGVAKITTKTVEAMDKNGVLTGTTTTSATGPYALSLRAMGLGIQALGPEAANKLLINLGYRDAEGKFSQDSPVALTPSHSITGTFRISGWSDAVSGSNFYLPGGLRLFGLSGDGIMGPFEPGKLKPEDPTLCFSAEANEDLSLKAPSGIEFSEVPKDTRVETPNLVFTAHWSLDGDTLSVHRDFTSRIDQQFCTGRVRQQTADALKKIADSYNTNISFKKGGSGAAAKPSEAEVTFDNGVAHINARQYDLAVQDFDKVISLTPDDAGAYANRGLAFERMKQYEKALPDFDKAISLKPDNAPYLELRAENYGNLREFDRAGADYDSAIKLSPNDASAYNGRGYNYLMTGKLDQAQADLAKAIALNPIFGAAYFNRAEVFMREKQYDAAILDFNEAVRQAPNNPILYRERGTAYMAKGLNELALADENQVLKLQPDDPGAAYNLGMIHMSTDKWAEAVDDFTHVITAKAEALSPYFTTQAYLMRAKSHEHLGHKAEAQADIEKATELDPTLKDGLAKK